MIPESLSRIVALFAVASINLLLLAGVATRALSDDPPIIAEKLAMDVMPSVAAMPKKRPISAYSHILSHPLFFRTREPYVARLPQTVIKAPIPPIVDPAFVLGGIVIVRNIKKAYIFRKNDLVGTWAGVGESVLGWEVQSIDSASARVVQQGRTIDVRLYAKRK